MLRARRETGGPWDEMPAVVLDNGSGNVKCGFAGDDVPKAVFGAITSHPRGSPTGPWLVGDDALKAKGQVYKYPIEHGIVTDWDGLERLWAHAFRELSVEPTEQAVLITEAPMNPTKNREKMAEVMFESFHVPGLHFQIQAVLTMYSAGRTDGLVLDSGDGITHAVPIFEGHTIPGAVGRSDIAGRDLTEWMMELLSDETDRPFLTSSDREIARTIKEKHCRVSQDFDVDYDGCENDPSWRERHTVEYELPDGSSISVCKATFCCPELLFNPQIAEKHSSSIQKLVYDSVQQCPIDLRRTLYGTILLSGGTTMFPGVETRLQQEVAKLCNARVADDVRVIAPNERKFSVWMGAAILSTLASFTSEWVTSQEYHEQGPQVVHRRCDSLTFVGK
ncbi:actin 2, putative [Bodo saltans]|uniref:Actin 2, putative n=1 Tax=Bodo saltans TaxID=75058 RepID=A0A0S4ISP2_BODSA|nr:actin 2, putative [Bodo saltans]|eukprot:CUF04194.1 actin 2, putative [Bodo saltans]